MFGLGQIIAPAVRGLGYGVNKINPNMLLEGGDLSRIWISGRMPDEQFVQLMRGFGAEVRGWGRESAQVTKQAKGGLTLSDKYRNQWDKPWQAFIRQQGAYPSPDQLNEMILRGFIDKDLYTALMQMNGYYDDGLIRAFYSLREQIPVVQDLIRFAVREAFDLATIQKFGYADEIPTNVEPFVAMQGLSGQTGGTKPASTGLDGKPDPERPATWFDMYWFSHWELPSLTQGYEMLHRLYVFTPHGPSPDMTADTQFDEQDMDTLLKAQDIPTYWRDRLKAISYLPLTRVDVRRMFKLGILGEDAVYHAYRAIGYNDENAEHLLRFTIADASSLTDETKLEVQKGKICTFYKQGILDREKARELLAAIKVSPIGTETFLDACDLDMSADHIKAMEANIKEAFMLGGFNADGLRTALMNLGISLPVVNNKVEEWEFERIVNRKEPSAQLMKGWYKDGLLTDDELTARMQNLNYESIYITNTLIQADRELSAARFKSQEKVQRETAAQAKVVRLQAEQAARAQQRTYQEQIKGLLASSTETNLKTWLKRGIITPQQAGYRLRLKGWPMEDISRWMTATDIELTEEMQDEIEKEVKDEKAKSAKE